MTKCFYSCDNCKIVKREVMVPERLIDQDILEWMKILQMALEIDHGIHSPNCNVRSLTNVMIPIRKTKNIGESND